MIEIKRARIVRFSFHMLNRVYIITYGKPLTRRMFHLANDQSGSSWLSGSVGSETIPNWDGFLKLSFVTRCRLGCPPSSVKFAGSKIARAPRFVFFCSAKATSVSGSLTSVCSFSTGVCSSGFSSVLFKASAAASRTGVASKENGV